MLDTLLLKYHLHNHHKSMSSDDIVCFWKQRPWKPRKAKEACAFNVHSTRSAIQLVLLHDCFVSTQFLLPLGSLFCYNLLLCLHDVLMLHAVHVISESKVHSCNETVIGFLPCLLFSPLLFSVTKFLICLERKSGMKLLWHNYNWILADLKSTLYYLSLNWYHILLCKSLNILDPKCKCKDKYQYLLIRVHWLFLCFNMKN